ncbi:MAG: carboxypeptidase regulatory-like domain-containing protein [Elusimicrobia bacterium]|nr:carboxypeptidase regulatory-like domain-containing protein [Candidatus Liberimonas magnetica]
MTKLDGVTTVGGAVIELVQSGVVKYSAVCDGNGNYMMTVAPGTYDVRASSAIYYTQTKIGTGISSGDNVVVNFALAPKVYSGVISGKITSADGVSAIPGGLIEVMKGGVVKKFMMVDLSGNYSIVVDTGTYDVRACYTGYQEQIKSGYVVTSTVTVNFALSVVVPDQSSTKPIIRTVAGTLYTGSWANGIYGLAAQLGSVNGIASDGKGNVYIVEGDNYRVRKVNAAGIITAFAGTGAEGYSGDGGPATSAMIYRPCGIAVDVTGNVYIADSYNNRVRKVDSSGIITTFAGNGSMGYSGDGGSATSAALARPFGIAVDGSGNVYISDSYNNRIRKVNSAGIISTVAGTGEGGYSGDGGPATSAKLNQPYGIAVDGTGNVYIADNRRIRKVDSTGIISTFAGAGGSGYTGDGGMATSVNLDRVQWVAVDGSGNVYVSKLGYDRVGKINSSGVMTYFAGGGYSSADGIDPALSELMSPYGTVAVDYSGNVYISEYSRNPRVRKVDLEDPSVQYGIICGRLTKPDGTAASGVVVELVGSNDVKYRETTDENGNYLLKVAPGTYNLVAVSECYYEQIQTGNVVANGDNVIANMTVSQKPQIGMISGKVTKADGTTELSGVIIKILQSGVIKSSTTTNSTGNYSITIGTGTYDVKVFSTGYYSDTKTGYSVTNGSTVTVNFALIQIPQKGIIFGKVTKSDCTTVLSGAIIQALQSGFLKSSATTDGNGNYSITVSTGSYDISAALSGYESQTKNTYSVTKGSTVTVNFSLIQIPQKGIISGKVTKLEGIPISGALVNVLQSNIIKSNAITNASGDYSVIIGTGTYDIAVSFSGYQAQAKSNYFVANGSTITVNFALTQIPQNGILLGKVTKSDGTTVLSGAIIQALQSNVLKSSATTNIDGNYSITICTGSYDVSASLSGYESQIKTGYSITYGSTVTVNLELTQVSPPTDTAPPDDNPNIPPEPETGLQALENKWSRWDLMAWGDAILDIASYNKNIYLSGYTIGNYDGNHNHGKKDVFLKKYDTEGNKLWSKLLGTTANDIGFSLAVNNTGNIYIAGNTEGTYELNTSSGSGDIFIAKYDSSGNNEWVRQKGSSNIDYANGIAIDSNNNLYVTGYTNGSMDGIKNTGGKDIFLIKYDNSGNRKWTKLLGSTLDDIGQCLTIDRYNNIYIAGCTEGNLNGNLNAGGKDIFVAKYDVSGNMVWCKQFGSQVEDICSKVKVDGAGNVYLLGTTAGLFDGNKNYGAIDILLIKIDPSGSKFWSKQFGTTSSDIATGLAIGCNSIYICGFTRGCVGVKIIGGVDFFILKTDLAGNVLCVKQDGKNTDETTYGLTLDGSENIYLSMNSSGMKDVSFNGEEFIGSGVYCSAGTKGGTRAFATETGLLKYIKIKTPTFGIISGKVTKLDGTTAICGAIVNASQSSVVKSSATTNATGNYLITLGTGTYDLSVSSSGYQSQLKTGYSVTNGSTVTVHFLLQPMQDTTAPSIPILTCPLNNWATAQTTISFDWQDSTDTVSGVAGYELQLSTNNQFKGSYCITTSVVSQIKLTNIVPNSYYWHVRAKDNKDNYSDWSDARLLNIKFIPIPVPADNVPPASMTGLLAKQGKNEGEIILTWSSPGDDNWTGVLSCGSQFRIQYSTLSTVGWSYKSAQISVSVSSGLPNSSTSYTVQGLEQGKEYYFRNWYCDEVQNWSEASNVVVSKAQVYQGVTAPKYFNGKALSTSSILWKWEDTTKNENGYKILNSSRVMVSGELAPNTTSWIESNLLPNTSYFRYAHVFNQINALNSDPCVVFTQANIPSGLVILNKNITSIEMSWKGNGICYAVERSTDTLEWTYSKTWQDNLYVTTYTDTGLVSDTSYYYRIRAYNGDKEITEPCKYITVKTKRAPPQPVSNLTTESLDNAKILLTWGFSSSGDISHYNIYYSTNPDFIDFSSPKGVVKGTDGQWISPKLTNKVVYYFVVRALDAYENEEQNKNFVSATALKNVSGLVKAAIKTPQNGKKVSGNLLMVMAEVVSGDIANTKDILFEFKTDVETAWHKIPAANVNHPNPDNDAPYFMHWDVNSMPQGKYLLRAVACDIEDVNDCSPGYITIEIDNSDPDVMETKGNDGQQVKKEKIDNSIDTTVKIGDENTNAFTQVIIPNGAIDTVATKIFVTVNPINTVALPENVVSINEYREIKLDNGAKVSGQVTLVIPYDDDNNDKIVDGTDIPVSILKVFAYSAETRKWEKLPTQIDAENKTAAGITTHFSLFAIFSAPPLTYDNIRAYPNPYKPGKGHSYIKFDNLTMHTRIQIFTIAGEIVFEKDDINIGEYSWNVKNQSGNDVASGVYICLMINDKGDKKIVKVAVIR